MANERRPIVRQPNLGEYRRNKRSNTAIVFIHGFSGNLEKTWGLFPQLLARDRRLGEWDILSLGYSTRLMFDLPGLWSADPEIKTLADLLRTTAGEPPMNDYENLALVAHSMGGLLVQRALVDDAEFSDKVSHVFLFGTPSAGLKKASLLTRLIRLKRQITDMAEDSEFINDLRKRWAEKFGKSRPFKFLSVAGDRDEFVPRTSSIEIFPQSLRRVVPGNHLQIVKPSKIEELSVQLVAQSLVGKAAVSGPLNSARVAAESSNFRRDVRLLEPNKAELDDAALVRLALALEMIGRQEDAIQVLEDRGHTNTDAMGVLAGRLKRRWLLERRDSDAKRARELYAEAFDLSERSNNSAQAFYHGINIAFMDLAYGNNREAAKLMANRVLAHCKRAPRDKWRLATEGEAHLLLGETEAALKSYEDAVTIADSPVTPREIASMYQQAVLVVGLVSSKTTASRLDSIFQKASAAQVNG